MGCEACEWVGMHWREDLEKMLCEKTEMLEFFLTLHFFFFYNNAGRGNDLNLAFSWKQEGWFHGQWGALEEFGVVT